eukprot:contig_10710_g2555
MGVPAGGASDALVKAALKEVAAEMKRYKKVMKAARKEHEARIENIVRGMAASSEASCVRIMRRLRGPFVAVVMAALAAAGSAVVVVTVTVKVVGAVAVPREHPAGDVTDPAARPQAAQEASGPTVIPFPAPPPSPWVGRFHELPSLQCRLHPTTPGGVSPDPEAVTNPFGRGGTGWVLRAHPEAVNVVVPYGAGTCASPLNDVFQLSYLAAPNEVRERWVFKASTNVSMGADATAEFAWAGGAYRAHLSWLAMQGSQVQESDGFRSSELFRPNPCTTAHARSGLVSFATG